jgi:hypothetical protein
MCCDLPAPEPDAFVGFSSAAFVGQSGEIYSALVAAIRSAFEAVLSGGSCAGQKVAGKSHYEGIGSAVGRFSWRFKVLGNAQKSANGQQSRGASSLPWV